MLLAHRDDTKELVETTMSQSHIRPANRRLALVAAAVLVVGWSAPSSGETVHSCHSERSREAAKSRNRNRQSAEGTVQDLTIPSKSYPPSRHLWVYTPAGYPTSCAGTCNLILAFDGGMYLGAMPLPRILDSLTAARRTPPTVAILFDNGGATRLDDLANHDRLASFVADELIPWARAKWSVTRDPSRTIITGSSAGGLAAAYIAFKHPDLFGNVLSQSGAFWRGNEGANDAPFEWVTAQYQSAPKKEIRFVLEVGALETTGAMGGAVPSLVVANRKLRDALAAKQYRVDYFEVPGGDHSPETWRVRLPLGIVALAPWR